MKDYHLTVGDLRKKLEGVPDNIPVLYQRIEDRYFDNGNWTTERYQQNSYDGPQNYIRAFASYYIEEGNVFVIEAHY